MVLFALVLLGAVLALYAPVRHYPFTAYDDDLYITNNTRVQMGMNGDTLHWALTTLEIGAWHPLTWLWHTLNYELFGANAGWHHLMSLPLHAANALLLFWVLLRATGYAGRSFMVAALFALHPMNVESVAWIAEQKNLLSMLFFLLALAAYRWYALRPGVGRYLAVASLYSLSLLAKPQVITFPVLLLLWDYWPLRRMFPPQTAQGEVGSGSGGGTLVEAPPPRSFRFLVLEKVPFAALAAGCTLLTMKAQGLGGGKVWYSFPLRLENAIVSYAKYLGKAVWPTRLAVFYPHPGNSLRWWQVAASCVLLLAITAVVVRARKHRYLIVGWCWFAIALLPMCGLKSIGHLGRQGMADRYAYLPFIGLFLMVVWQLAEWSPTRAAASREATKGGRRLLKWLPDAGIGLLAVLAVLSHRQLGNWSSNVTLWSHAIEVTDPSGLAENNLGSELASEGKLREALPHFQKAAAINPTDPAGVISLALWEEREGNPAGAVEYYKQAIAISRDVELERPSIAILYADLGQQYQDLGDYENALENFQEATRWDAGNFLGWAGLGINAQRTGRLEVAIEAYRHANKLGGGDVGYLLLAEALQQTGHAAEAQEALAEAHRRSLDFDRTQQAADRLLGK